MAISQEALSSPAVVLTPTTAAMQYSKVARLEHFVGRRGSDYRYRADPGPFDPSRLNEEFDELTIRFEPEQHALWCIFNHTERPCFTRRFLDQIVRLQTRPGTAFDGNGERRHAPAHAGLGLEPPGLWNLGGDLELFTRLIRAQAAEELRSRVRLCRRGVPEPDQDGAALPRPSLLVQGDALGGGFESALTNDVIIAERGSRMGLPEVLFNMFPGMGAYSLLCRRLDCACPADDPEWPVIRDRRARGARTGGSGGRQGGAAAVREYPRAQPTAPRHPAGAEPGAPALSADHLRGADRRHRRVGRNRSWPRPSRSAADGASGPGAGAAPCPNAPGAGEAPQCGWLSAVAPGAPDGPAPAGGHRAIARTPT